MEARLLHRVCQTVAVSYTGCPYPWALKKSELLLLPFRTFTDVQAIIATVPYTSMLTGSDDSYSPFNCTVCTFELAMLCVYNWDYAITGNESPDCNALLTWNFDTE